MVFKCLATTQGCVCLDTSNSILQTAGYLVQMDTQPMEGSQRGDVVTDLLGSCHHPGQGQQRLHLHLLPHALQVGGGVLHLRVHINCEHRPVLLNALMQCPCAAPYAARWGWVLQLHDVDWQITS